MRNFDVIIAGGGCAGLSLAVRLINSNQFTGKQILLVDREAKSENDRTWCFWEAQPGLFDPIVYSRWDKLHFHGKDYSRLLDILPYQYKMIRGIDFYMHCNEVINKNPNVTFLRGHIDSLVSEGTRAIITVDGETFSAPYAFSSIPRQVPDANRYFYLKQHFKGWTVKTQEPVFDPAQATLMDFRTDQRHGTTFIYVLPFSAHEALIEYTLFSKDLLEQQDYDNALVEYIRTYVTTGSYDITSTEFGVIPMTNFPFKVKEGRVINIGTAGGHTKASTGYTFQFIQKATQHLVSSWITGGAPAPLPSSRKYSFYDSTLLSILQARRLEGVDVFTDLFRNGDPQTVLKFLDNETTIGEDINIMRRLPTGVFGAAAMKYVFGGK